jgi:hypothetical protein
MSKDIVVTPEPKKQKKPTEAKAAQALTDLFYSKIGGKYRCGPKLLGWCDATEEPRHWKLEWFKFVEPVNDHLKGNFRGLVAKEANYAPIIPDFDRHHQSIDPVKFRRFVLNSFDWLSSEFPEVNWATAEVNPKNGSTKVYGFDGSHLFPIERAKEIASAIKNHLGIECYPVDPQMLLPMRKDKVTVVASGILGRCKRYRMVKNLYDRKRKRCYYRTYSALDFAGNLISKQALCLETLEKVLSWSATMPSGKLNPKQIKHRAFAQLYRRVRNKALVEKMWDFESEQPLQYFQDSWKLMFQCLDCSEPVEKVINDFIKRYSCRATLKPPVPLAVDSQDDLLKAGPVGLPVESPRPAKSRTLNSVECQLIQTEWLKGEEDAFKRDGLLTKAIFRILNGQPSEDFVVEVKEDLQLFTGDFDERKARDRISWWVAYSAKTFQPSQSGVSVEVVNRYLDEARKIVRQQIWYVEKRRTKNGFDDSGMPIGEWKIKRKLASKEKARQMVAGVLNAVDFAVQNEGGSTSKKFIEQTMKKMFGWFDWSIYKAVQELLEKLGVVVIVDRNHRVGKCWVWQRPEKRKKAGGACRKLYSPQHLSSLVTLSEGIFNSSGTEYCDDPIRLLKPPD